MLVVTILLILTKLLDVLSTLKRIRHYSNETNPFARKMMLHWGPRATVWIVFAIALLIICVAGGMAFLLRPVFQIIYLFFGSAISGVQFAVAAANWTGRDNFVTSQVRKVYGMLHRLMP